MEEKFVCTNAWIMVERRGILLDEGLLDRSPYILNYV